MKTDDISLFIKKHTSFCIAVVVMLVAYFPTFKGMWGRWFAADSYYSHGFLIPLVSLYLVWQMKEELKKLPVQKTLAGLVVIIAGVIIHFFATQFRVNFIAGFGTFFVFTGIVLHYFGWTIFRKVGFPVFFLIFMLPLPSVLIVKLSWQLKMMAADLATDILNHMRIPAVQEGSLIRMRHAQVVVDDVCSGLRSLISLTALGALFAYWFKGSFFKRLIIVLSTIPTAIITNTMRVVILATVSEIWGAEYIEGFIHDATGYMIFIVAFLIMYFLSRLME